MGKKIQKQKENAQHTKRLRRQPTLVVPMPTRNPLTSRRMEINVDVEELHLFDGIA